MEDGCVVDPNVAQWEVPDRTVQRRSVITGSEWERESLCLSQHGRLYIYSYQARSPRDAARYVDAQEAARWLLLNGYSPDDETMPPELRPLMQELLK
jgi:hypothetical protein